MVRTVLKYLLMDKVGCCMEEKEGEEGDFE